MDCPTPRDVLPVNFQGARLVYGVGFLERADGKGGCFLLPPGWYYSDEGRARIAATVDRWQGKIEALQARLDAIQPQLDAIQIPTPSEPRPPPEHDPSCFAAWAGCLVVGFVCGRLSRHPRGV